MSLVESRRNYYAQIRRSRSNVRAGALFGLEVEIGGAGVPEWQKTNRALIASNEEIEGWARSVEKTLPGRVESDEDRWSDCDKDASKATKLKDLAPCLTSAENDTQQFLRDYWNPLVKEWNDLVARAKTGVPWGDDDELRKIQGRIVAARKEFSDRSGYQWKRTLPPWSPDRGFFQAIKESTGADIPGTAEELARKAAGAIPWGTVAAVAGIGLGVALLLKSK